MQWETVIGLEIHAQLSTQSKIFSGASTTFGAEANANACAIDLGLPGVLPVLNQQAVYMALKFGLAIGAKIPKYSVFSRKNYFYPDLPKGYQISQFEFPIVGNGTLSIEVNGVAKTIGITRAHLEEDAGKSLHENFQGLSGIDFNRAGTPLLEIVSDPDMCSAKEAVAYAKKIHTLVQYLAICDGNMQEGSFRCDVNISVRPDGQKQLGVRTEIKNLNSFRFIEQAINHEVKRQINLLEAGDNITQETRLYDAAKNETRPMRSKEELNDYRYFPDPDLLPLLIDDQLKQKIALQLPELPDAKKQRFIEQYKLDLASVEKLITSRALADYFEATLEKSGCEAKLCANWIIGDLSGALNKQGLDISQSPVSYKRLADLLAQIANNIISGKIAKQVFAELWQSNLSVTQIIQQKNLKQITDSNAITAIIEQIIIDNPKSFQQLKSGKNKLFGFFVGQVMKATQGKANPREVNKLLQEKLQ